MLPQEVFERRCVESGMQGFEDGEIAIGRCQHGCNLAARAGQRLVGGQQILEFRTPIERWLARRSVPLAKDPQLPETAWD